MSMPYGNSLEDQTGNDPDGAVAFGLIMRPLLQYWHLIALGTLCGLLAGFLFAVMGGPSYTVSMTVIPAESNTGQTSSLGSLPSLLGSSSDGPLSKYKQFQAAFNSNGMAELLEQRYDGLCGMMPDRCDPQTHQWKERPGGHPFVRRFLDPFIGEPRDSMKPDATQVAAFIKNRVKLDVDKSSVTTLAMTCEDYARCEDFLAHLVDTANEFVKNSDRGPLNAYVDYLTHQLGTLTNVSQRSALDQLLLDEERRLMMTQVGVEYAAMTLDKPHSALNPPIRTLLVWPVVGLVISIALAFFLAFRASKPLWGGTLRSRGSAMVPGHAQAE